MVIVHGKMCPNRTIRYKPNFSRTLEEMRASYQPQGRSQRSQVLVGHNDHKDPDAPVKDPNRELHPGTQTRDKMATGMTLYDLYACNALACFAPQEQSEYDKLKADQGETQVHVVVDPLQGNNLRPHQRGRAVYVRVRHWQAGQLHRAHGVGGYKNLLKMHRLSSRIVNFVLHVRW
ncbi:uncharacterized protein LOC119769461 isoform X2 [Culex quinquefasciatus]|uniref:uncharacterized protein LOC119769461 isoform X2 n=1 Tax=Culex quinquefasciatus TaxID=7176 RepID=UPI0018E3D0E7|nr:uncharacterized protein LOC119769461 isoform X2 [Culex quinquefasciatus]